MLLADGYRFSFPFGVLKQSKFARLSRQKQVFGSFAIGHIKAIPSIIDFEYSLAQNFRVATGASTLQSIAKSELSLIR